LTDHPTPAEIAGLARGRLSHSSRRRLVAHLLRGCQRCSQLLAPALFLTPSLLSRYGCRRSARLLAAPAAEPAEGTDAAGQPPPGEPESCGLLPHLLPHLPAMSLAFPAFPVEAYDQPIRRACAAAMRCYRELEQERRAVEDAVGAGGWLSGTAAPGAAPELAAAAVGGGASEGHAAHGSDDLRPRRGPLEVEMLLAASADQRYTDPQEMVHLAELALFAAERLEQDRYGRAVISDMRARAWAELANAYRVAEDFVEAEQAMVRAVGWQSRGSGDPWLVARIATLMASLLADERRFADAGELLDQVHAFYCRTGDRHLAGRTLITRGIFAGYDNEPREALTLLTQGLEMIDSREDWRLAAQAVQAILWNLVECRRYRQARIHLWRSRSLLVRHGGSLHLLRLRWLDGRIYAGLGDLGRAERELLATRQGFEAAGSPYDAALVSLDLAAVWLRQRKTSQVRLLVDEMIATFRALRIGREAVAALLLLREARDGDEPTLERVRAVALLLAELERQPRRRAGASVFD